MNAHPVTWKKQWTYVAVCCIMINAFVKEIALKRRYFRAIAPVDIVDGVADLVY